MKQILEFLVLNREMETHVVNDKKIETLNNCLLSISFLSKNSCYITDKTKGGVVPVA